MKVFGINVAEGSDIKNLTVASGTSFPSSPNDAEMFYRADTDGSVRGLYVYINGAWDRIGSAAAVTVPANAPLPSTANMGDLFYLNSNDVTEGLYVYSGSSWVQATNPGSSPATATGDVTGTITPGANSPLTLASVGTAGTYFNVTTDVKGRVIYGSNPTTLTGFGITDAQPLDGDLTAIAALSGTSGYLKKTAANTYSLDTSTFITGNESITLSGDATGSGTTAITVTLASVGTAGSKGSASTVPVFVTDAKGRVTSSTDTSIAISASQTTSGTFADARIAQSNVTQHQAALTILESQITDGTILARVGANETITGSWQFNNPVVVPTPVSGSNATTKDYVDQAIAGLSWKNSALVGTTANITLSGTQTIDGVSVVAGNRVLVKNQSTQSENGVYVVASGAWTRATDFDSVSPIDEINSAAVFVQLGTTQADTAWTQVSPVATVGTDAITFTQFAGANTFVAGAGLTLSGNTFNVGTANSANIVVNTDNIDLATIGTPVTDVLKRISTDSYGRVSATSAVQASDLTGVLDSVYVNVTGDTMTGTLNGTGATFSGTLQLTSTSAIHKVGNINFAASNGSTTNWLYAGSSNLTVRDQGDTANLLIIDSAGALSLPAGSIKLGSSSTTYVNGSDSSISLGINSTEVMGLNSSGAVSFSSAFGTNGQVLTSHGSALPPTWTPVAVNQLQGAVSVINDSNSPNALRPISDNILQLGATGSRWKQVFAATAVISTSDEQLKEQISNLSDVERVVAIQCKGLIKKFKFKDAVQERGAAARWHIGVIAQELEALFSAHGLDASEYGMFCKDTWFTLNDEVVPAGTSGAVEVTRRGIRYEELLAFVISAM